MECIKTHVTQEGFACLKKETVKSGSSLQFFLEHSLAKGSTSIFE